MLKAALHVHSTYSDGEFSLSELKRIFTGQACSVVCMTDHAESFDEEKLLAYVEECQSLSDDSFRFVAGLEYECEQRMHILGYGTTVLAGTQDPQKVIRQIEDHDGIPVIAHPKNEFFDWIEAFELLPQGIEVWNSKYDGRYAPRPGTFVLLRRLRERKPDTCAFYGQDLHWKKQFRGLFVTVDCPTNQPQQILTALSRGRFSGYKGNLELPSSGIVPEELLSEFGRAHERSYRMWHLLKRTKGTLDRMSIRVPESLKSQLRRIF